MNKTFSTIFSGFIAVILLALYSGSTFYMVGSILLKCKIGGAEVCPPQDFGDGLIYITTTVGGLVSALILATLGASDPNGQVKVGNFRAETTTGQFRLNVVVVIYLIAWMITGLAALVVGVMLYPKASDVVSSIGTTWFGLALSAAYAYFGISPGDQQKPQQDPAAAKAASATVTELEAQIAAGKIIFDAGKETQLKSELLGTASGTKATAKLQKLVLELSKSQNIRVSSIVRTQGHHGAGRAVDIGNEEIAGALLPTFATNAKVNQLEIDEIIFDAAIAGQADRNTWNYDQGTKHAYDTATRDDHKDHIHFAVKA